MLLRRATEPLARATDRIAARQVPAHLPRNSNAPPELTGTARVASGTAPSLSRIGSVVMAVHAAGSLLAPDSSTGGPPWSTAAASVDGVGAGGGVGVGASAGGGVGLDGDCGAGCSPPHAAARAAQIRTRARRGSEFMGALPAAR